MKLQTIIRGLLVLSTIQMARADLLYKCDSEERPEHAGYHNMVVFGKPDDVLYAYHLPLFKSALNGVDGHVLMHIYQALWSIKLDDATQAAYKEKFEASDTEQKPIPFFTLSPQRPTPTFKVPEMICNENFSMKAKVVYGHVEGNEEFPAPENLISELSDVKRSGATIFARRFDDSAKTKLSYFVFGTTKQLYMAHFLTHDENSYDQILAIETSSEELKALVADKKSPLVEISNTPENGLAPVASAVELQSPNNKFKASSNPLGKKVKVESAALPLGSAEITITADVYFNKNTDLQRTPPQ